MKAHRRINRPTLKWQQTAKPTLSTQQGSAKVNTYIPISKVMTIVNQEVKEARDDSHRSDHKSMKDLIPGSHSRGLYGLS